jgi:hypothetical protein
MEKLLPVSGGTLLDPLLHRIDVQARARLHRRIIDGGLRQFSNLFLQEFDACSDPGNNAVTIITIVTLAITK